LLSTIAEASLNGCVEPTKTSLSGLCFVVERERSSQNEGGYAFPTLASDGQSYPTEAVPTLQSEKPILLGMTATKMMWLATRVFEFLAVGLLVLLILALEYWFVLYC
jgi:hypothetical protein